MLHGSTVGDTPYRLRWARRQGSARRRAGVAGQDGAACSGHGDGREHGADDGGGLPGVEHTLGQPDRHHGGGDTERCRRKLSGAGCRSTTATRTCRAVAATTSPASSSSAFPERNSAPSSRRAPRVTKNSGTRNPSATPTSCWASRRGSPTAASTAPAVNPAMRMLLRPQRWPGRRARTAQRGRRAGPAPIPDASISAAAHAPDRCAATTAAADTPRRPPAEPARHQDELWRARRGPIPRTGAVPSDLARDHRGVPPQPATNSFIPTRRRGRSPRDPPTSTSCARCILPCRPGKIKC